MNFLVRPVKREDIDSICEIAKQFSLLNLPPVKTKITKIVETSIQSFSGKLDRTKSRYMFVIEEIDTKKIAGCCQLVAKHGTELDPNYSIQIIKKERFSEDLGVGFIHQILRLRMNEDGPTEIAGLVVDRGYRGRPEKIGRLLSLTRFLYIGLHQDRFEDELLAEMAPPLSEDGRSDFWEAYGRRFTGMSYKEADTLSHENKGFIKSLFPEEDIYLCLLDAKARLSIGRVGEETRPALHLLEKQGFKYNNEVDPFDGGPHVVAKKQEVTLIKKSQTVEVSGNGQKGYTEHYFIATEKEGSFKAGQTAATLENDHLFLPERTMRALNLEEGDKVYISPVV
ncbi:MAG: arginine N-succinyltransferase [Bdellovibrionales bacterium]|nr:arginine N-succinyltransferase [Bdellovibrionales bacterium]